MLPHCHEIEMFDLTGLTDRWPILLRDTTRDDDICGGLAHCRTYDAACQILTDSGYVRAKHACTWLPTAHGLRIGDRISLPAGWDEDNSELPRRTARVYRFYGQDRWPQVIYDDEPGIVWTISPNVLDDHRCFV